MSKDLDFLREMKQLTEALLEGDNDDTKLQQLDEMIQDWINELDVRQTKNNPSNNN